MQDNQEYWAVTATSYRAVSGPDSLVEGETLVEGSRPVIPYLDNLGTQYELRTKADAIIKPLQESVDVNMASDEKKTKLLVWKRYKVLLMRVDIMQADPDWPSLPA